MPSPAERLRAHLAATDFTVMPCCFDGLSAKMIGDAGFPVTFMSGFAVSATRIGAPDTGLISYGEMVDTGRNVCAATRALVIGDGDTGYGNALNVKRTVKGYAQAGFAAVMIEDQVAPKRCGHTKGKLVVDRAHAVDHIKAAVDAREEGADILILARTDARHGLGLDEALERARLFKEAGADILFVEAPKSRAEMETICREVPGWHMANMVEGGETPILPRDELAAIGYRLAAYPLTLLSAAMKAMRDALAAMAEGRHPDELLLDFAELRDRVGFNAYYEAEQRYADRRD
ncbi:isocitrate lyase/PEP mutase family protein [Stappia sp. F7233]|uniref:Isocitrate lyase/PEP mutase family protein n=1 Tax=Stappia albiluteola TaxID=2758565 RepID=A0A839AJB0_9HYPH|nr:isocitrate lyase/PEP mutase family protein [Stappia albiluteola]MBA5779034.1 isocitrate lyase/PEP mutase family protein [Stappia albiluteola]